MCYPQEFSSKLCFVERPSSSSLHIEIKGGKKSLYLAPDPLVHSLCLLEPSNRDREITHQEVVELRLKINMHAANVHTLSHVSYTELAFIKY
jgi:hypothetical protein